MIPLAGRVVTWTFDRDIQVRMGTADPTARLRMIEDGDEVMAVSAWDGYIHVQGNRLSWTIPPGRKPSATLVLQLDKGFVGEAQNRSGYLHKPFSLFFSTDGLPPEATKNFSMALTSKQLPLETTTSKLCAVLQKVLVALSCQHVEATQASSGNIVRWRVFDLAYNSSVWANAYISKAYHDGLLSDLLSAQGLGTILPGSWVEQTADVYRMVDLEATLLPAEQGKPTVATLYVTLSSAWTPGEILEVYFPPAMRFGASPGPNLVVGIGNVSAVGPNVMYLPSGQIGIGASGTSLILNTAGLFSLAGQGPRISIVVEAGLQMPSRCSDFGIGFISPYTVKRYSAAGYSADRLIDFISADPLQDSCIAPKVVVGVPLPTVLTTSLWISFLPTVVPFQQEVALTFEGGLLNNWQNNRRVYVKVAQLPADHSCTGYAYESKQDLLLNLKTIKTPTFIINNPGTYDVCFRESTTDDWSRVLSSQLTVEMDKNVETFRVSAPALSSIWEQLLGSTGRGGTSNAGTGTSNPGAALEASVGLANLGELNIPVVPSLPTPGETQRPLSVPKPSLGTVSSSMAPPPVDFESPQDLFFGPLATCAAVIGDNAGTSSGYCGCTLMNDGRSGRPYVSLGDVGVLAQESLIDLLKRESGILLGCCSNEPLAMRAAMKNHDGSAQGYKWGLCASSS